MWIKRMDLTQEMQSKRAKMFAAASVDVDLFVARQSKVIEIPVESQEDTDDLIEMIAEKKAAGEIATDQEFRIEQQRIQFGFGEVLRLSIAVGNFKDRFVGVGITGFRNALHMACIPGAPELAAHTMSNIVCRKFLSGM